MAAFYIRLTLQNVFTLNCVGKPPQASECQNRYISASKNPVPGQYIPWCTPDGEYEKIQCFDTYCFCVDKKGREIKSTDLSRTQGKPDCDEKPGK